MTGSSFSVVLHGPAAVYSGEAEEVISFLTSRGSVSSVAGGTMCRTAIIDTGLDVDVSRCDPPSVAIMSGDGVRVLVNHGKTVESGIAFGAIVSRRAAPLPLIQVERLREKDGIVIVWSHPDRLTIETAKAISDKYGLRLDIRNPPCVKDESVRYVAGIAEGEPLYIDGHFVGVISGKEVSISSNGGRLELKGVRIKETGLERASGTVISSAMVKSGKLREGRVNPFMPEVKGGKGFAAVIDHGAFSSLDIISEDIVCAITIGDDTTCIASDILARKGIRTIGVVDGDGDSLLEGGARAPGSVTLWVTGITDDEAGKAATEAVRDAHGDFDSLLSLVKACFNSKNISYEERP